MNRLLPRALLAIAAVPALAHRLSPAYLGLTERAAGRFDVEWKVSVPGGLADALEPRIPGLAWSWRRRLPLPDWWPRAVAYGIGSIAAFWVLERGTEVFV